MNSKSLINADEANLLLNLQNVKFVDATWYMPNEPKDARNDYIEEHIPTAVYFDIDEISDQSIDLPHMYPSLELFESSVSQLGISQSDEIIVYDRSNYFASARVWWLFRSFGHQRVKVLNGGLKAWKSIGGSTESGAPKIEISSYKGRLIPDHIEFREQLKRNLFNPDVAILDARSKGRFDGTEAEPRPGLLGGHIPGSQNFYYGDVIDDDGMIRDSGTVSQLINDLQIREDQRVVTTCGSGVTAAILLLAIFQFRQNGLSMYDGSWTEWALHPQSPIATIVD